MIIVDEHADVKLASALEVLKADPDTTRCLYFNLNTMPEIPGLAEAIVASARTHIGLPNAHVYLCEDRDIFILAPTLASKDGRCIMLDAATHAGIPASESWIGFYDVAFEINKLLVVIEEKLEVRRKAEVAAHQLSERQQSERKRQAILNGGTVYNSDDIKKRRAERATPELMIIEDDAFLRKLVDNVLQKQYSLTSLGEATRALDTYARIAPDILFLDINLPDVTGHELLERIIKMDPDAYVIMLSGSADQANITSAMKRGAKGFIAKPFTRDKLFQYIDRCPTLRQSERTSYARV